MVIDQRNAGASVTPTAGQYLVDRWQAATNVTAKFSAQQSTTAPVGFTNSLLVTSLSAYSIGAGELCAIRHRIEGYNVADLGWGTANAKTITISFWVRSSLTGTFGGSLMNATTNRSYPFTYTISVADTFEYKTVTIAGDTSGTWNKTNDTGISVLFGLGVGSSLAGTAGAWAASEFYGATGATSVVGTNGATFYITGVQLEVGTQATSFEYRQYGTELQLCQRYCQNFRAADWNDIYRRYCTVLLNTSLAYNGILPLLVKMRTAPTLTTGGTFNLWNGSFLDGVSAPTLASASADIVDITGVNNSGTNGGIYHLLSDGNNTSFMLFTAEL
jgi:hypothetical protein